MVALLRDLPAHGLVRGQVGTVVQLLSPTVAEVEFSDDEGRAYAMAVLSAEELIRLHPSPLELVARRIGAAASSRYAGAPPNH